MEWAGKRVEDDELRAAMEAKGFGPPATRASTIEGLIREEYVNRDGRELVPTPKAFSLMFALHMLHIVELASPELTGEWEHKLKLIEAGGIKDGPVLKGSMWRWVPFPRWPPRRAPGPCAPCAAGH